MAAVLVTGTGRRAERLADRLGSLGHEVRLADPGEPLELVERSLDYYLQLPVTVTLEGDSLVARAHSFLAGGLLTRYQLVARLLPALGPAAGVVLVSGNRADMSSLPDDRYSRLALLNVLAHATRAELVDRNGRVQVVSGERSDEEIVRFLLHGGEDATVRVLEDAGAPTGKQYEDWRAEVMGLLGPVRA